MTVKRKPLAGRVRLAPAPEKRAGKAKVRKELIDHFAPSGIDEALIEQLMIVYVEVTAGRVPAARIPYFDVDGRPTGFHRDRYLIEYTPAGDTKPRRYTQPSGSGCHLYLPPVGGVSWARVAVDPEAEVLITEGEKKAACATARGFPTIGLGGIRNWRADGGPIEELDWIAWERRTVYVAFDSPDVEKNKAVADAAEALGEELRERGATVRFIQLPTAGEKVGLDDFLVAEGVDALRSIMESATDTPVDAVSILNRELAMVVMDGKALVLREVRKSDGQVDVSISRPQDIAPYYDNMSVRVATKSGSRYASAFDLWRKSPRRREYSGVVFEPGGAPEDRFNHWRGFAVQPVAGDCGLFIDFLRTVICSGNAELSEYALSWMAHAVQIPAELPGTALVLRGKQGVGKSMFCTLFGQLFGRHFVTVAQQKHLLGNFNRHLERALVVLAEEAFWAGDHQAEGVLKDMITCPTRVIEAKGRDAYSVSNYARLMVATNHEWAVPAGLEERRMVVIDVSDARIQDHAYFGRLHRQMLNGGLQALMHWLLQRDISKFQPRSIPKTQALLDQKLRSLSGGERFVYEMLVKGSNSRGGQWARDVPKSTLHAMYLGHSNDIGTKRRAAESELGRVLKRLLPSCRTHRPRAGRGEQPPHWRFADLGDSRKEFERAMGQPIDWSTAQGE